MAWLNRGTDALYRMSQPVGGWRDVGGGVLTAYAAYRKFTTTSTCDLFGTITPGSSNYFSYFRQSAIKLETQIKTTSAGRWDVGNGAPPAGRWQIVVCVMRYSGAEMWIANTADGSISNGTGTYFRNPTDPPSCMYVGESPAGDGGQDFEIALPTFWHGDLGSGPIGGLLRGVHPHEMRPSSIAMSLPLDGSRRELVTGVPMVGLNMAGTTFTDDPAFLRGLRTVVFFPGVQVPLYRRGSQPLGQVAGVNTTINPTGATVLVSAGSPVLEHLISPAGAEVLVEAGAPTLAVTLSPAGANVLVEAGGPDLIVGTVVSPTGAQVLVEAGSPTLSASLAPAGASVLVQAGGPSLQVEIAPPGAGVLVEAGDPDLIAGVVVSPTGAQVLVEAGSPTLAAELRPAGAAVLVEAGAPHLDVALYPAGAEVLVDAGGPSLSLNVLISPTGAEVVVQAGDPTVTVQQSPIARRLRTVRAGYTITTNAGHMGTARAGHLKTEGESDG